jgi:uncharacterized membrane protein YdjX (TVP38/TMEM64 family)
MRRLIPFLILLALVAAAWAAGLWHALSWAALGRHEATLTAWVAAHTRLAPLAYALAYAAMAALSVPAGAFLTVAGGLLFGAILGGTLAIMGATAGATVLFLAARTALGEPLAKRAGPRMQALRERLLRDGFFYLLAIRIVPAFPFWLVNLAAALCGMRFLAYVAATFLGIMPAAFAYAWIGAGVRDVLTTGGEPDFGLILSPQVLGPRLALAALALLPVVLRRRTPPPRTPHA